MISCGWFVMLAESDAVTAGRITGMLLPTVLITLGLVKCGTILKRPTANRNCVTSLTLALSALLALFLLTFLVPAFHSPVSALVVRILFMLLVLGLCSAGV